MPDDLKRSTRALQKTTSREKGVRETPDIKGTGAKAKIDTIPFPGDNCRSFLYCETATTGAAADVSVQNRDNIICNDDVKQSLEDLIVWSQTQIREEECWPRQNKSGISQVVADARVQSRSDIAEKGYGPNPEDSLLCASAHIYEIMGCDHTTNKDNQEEEKLGSKVPCQIVPPMVLQHGLLLGRGLLLADIEPRIDPLLGPMVDGISHSAPY